MSRWFLPDAPDLLGLLGQQGTVTVAGIDAYAAWANGDLAQQEAVRANEHDADLARRAVLDAVRRAFVTPVPPEDIYELAERLDEVMNGAKDLVREAELLAMTPDEPLAEMADLVAVGVRSLVAAFPHLVDRPGRATEHADDAVQQQRSMEHVYRRAMSGLLDDPDLREVMGRRELYRRSARLGDAVEAVAWRIWYAVVKET